MMQLANVASIFTGALEIYLLCGSFWSMWVYNEMLTIESPYFASMCADNGTSNGTDVVSFCQERAELFRKI